jgi:hypothetical protein
MQIKAEWPKFRAPITPNVGKDMELLEPSFIVGGNAKWSSHLQDSLEVVFYNTKHTLTL